VGGNIGGLVNQGTQPQDKIVKKKKKEKTWGFCVGWEKKTDQKNEKKERWCTDEWFLPGWDYSSSYELVF